MNERTRELLLDKMRHRNWLIFSVDFVLSMFCSLAAVLIFRWMSDPLGSFNYLLAHWMLFSALGTAVAFGATRSYKIIILHSSYNSIGIFGIAVLLKSLVMVTVISTNLVFSSNSQLYAILLIDAAFTFVALIVFRLLVINITNSFKHDDYEMQVRRLRVMVYGVDNKSASMVLRLSESKHYVVNGILTFDDDRVGQIIMGAPIYCLSGKDSLRELRNHKGIDCILFPHDIDVEKEKDRLVKYCIDLGIHILNMPSVSQVNYSTVTLEVLNQVNSEDSEYILDGMTSFERNLKRIIDCIAAALLLIILCPLSLVCFIAIISEDHGPAIYKQKRIGRFGHPFNIYKFRSMRVDAEEMGPALYAGEKDPRLTKVGAFLRTHHLDELPQLWNVFIGDMAFVGYRPERKYYIDQIMKEDPRYYFLYQIRPGVTSYATLKNGYTDTMEKMLVRLDYDIYYLRNRSFVFDVKILGMTFLSIVFGKKF